MSDLRVDYETLAQCAATAKQVKGGFEDLPSRVGDTGDCWGHGGIAGAMHTFGTNWGYHRKVLGDEIEKTGEKIEKCLQAFEDADRKLAEELRKSLEHSQ